MTRTQEFAESLVAPPAIEEHNLELREELKRALTLAENALMQAKLALAIGDLDAANASLEAAGEAHSLAQRIRTGVFKKTAA